MKTIATFKTSLIVIFLLSLSPLFLSCSDDDSETLLPESERIVGTWTIKESTVLGFTIPGDGSTLTFIECGTTCTGVDFLASDSSTGTFTYVFTNDNTILSIDDNDALSGGSYSGDWTIDKFTNSTLTLSGSSILGEVAFTFTK